MRCNDELQGAVATSDWPRVDQKEETDEKSDPMSPPEGIAEKYIVVS